MKMIDRGGGTAIVVIPGIQGRWEWMKPAIDTLAQRCRVITFSLADEPTSGGAFDERRGIESYVEQVRAALDMAGVQQAAICGVSYGGLIAGAFAARFPERAASLVLVSAIPPSWTPDSRVRFYLRAPTLLAPLFCIGSVRLCREIFAAEGGQLAAGTRAATRHAWRVLTHFFSPRRMARRVRLLDGATLEAELARVNVPTLVVTGDSALDRVVPTSLSQEHLRLWPHARVATIANTGHLGLITRPDEFARIVVPFAESAARLASGAARRRIG
jgi:pimeloyl-ACP methyl ester carboxylesterase